MFEDGNWLCFVGLVLIPLALWMRSRFGNTGFDQPPGYPFDQPPGYPFDQPHRPGYPPNRPGYPPNRPGYPRTPKSDMQYSVVGIIVGAAILLFLMIQIGR